MSDTELPFSGRQPRSGPPLDFPEFRNFINPFLDPNNNQPPERIDVLAKKIYEKAATGQEVELDPAEKEIMRAADARALEAQMDAVRARIREATPPAPVDIPRFPGTSEDQRPAPKTENPITRFLNFLRGKG
jgi:hypothetical protein